MTRKELEDKLKEAGWTEVKRLVRYTADGRLEEVYLYPQFFYYKMGIRRLFQFYHNISEDRKVKDMSDEENKLIERFINANYR